MCRFHKKTPWYLKDEVRTRADDILLFVFILSVTVIVPVCMSLLFDFLGW